jgi:ribosomal protein S18 acetylase RimI-like enzyme
MGEGRIRRNLGLSVGDVVLWCQEQIKTADGIVRRGKNFYAYKDGVCITINAHSFTVITAHTVKAKIRELTDGDYPVLPDFLYQAIFIPKGIAPPPRDIIREPEIFVYIQDFGTQSGDLGVAAEVNGQVVGMAWTRIIPTYGHLDNDTPELAISLLPGFRGCGIGAALMQKLFVLLQSAGYQRTSLSVQKDNPAVRFYKRLGYRITDEKQDHAGHEDYIMVKDLT